EMALASDIGVMVTTDPSQAYAEPLHAWLFGEDQGRYLIAVPEGGVDPILRAAAGTGVPVRRIGTTGGAVITVNGQGAVSVAELKALHENWLPVYMA
ncbi:MAG: phosphoribosylformylglycinamidine synthase, partial [Rhodospirillaceae bacterium]